MRGRLRSLRLRGEAGYSLVEMLTVMMIMSVVFAGITTVTIGPATEKVTVTLPDNCGGISFQRQDDPGNWATIAYNLGI